MSTSIITTKAMPLVYADEMNPAEIASRTPNTSPPDDRAGDAAGPAQNERCESLQTDGTTHGWIHVDDGGRQHARRRGKSGPDGKHQRIRGVDGDSHRARGFAILRGSAHRFANFRSCQEHIQPHHEHGRDGDEQKHLRQQSHPADNNGLIGQRI